MISNTFSSDNEFNKLYPLQIQLLDRRHWTPVDVARKASRFLANKKHVNILDIGSGSGKFCLVAAKCSPDAFYFGVEQRKTLFYIAERTRQLLKMDNVSFIHGNFSDLNFDVFDNFYFYNSFHENLDDADTIDDSIEYSVELYIQYNRQLFKKLESRPKGTRLVTFHSLGEEVPPGFKLVDSMSGNLLEFWIKE